MRILFINRSYYPDVEATGQLLSELCADLARSHRVSVIAGRPNFVAGKQQGGLTWRESHEGVEIVRVRNLRFRKVRLVGRVVGLTSYLFLALWAALWHSRPDVIVVETDPPALGLLGAFLKWWHRCPMVYYLQDLFPEVGLALGRFRPGLLTGLLRWMTQAGLRHADRVVVVGEDMRRLVLARGVAPGKIEVVPNWVDPGLVRPCEGHNPLRSEWGGGGKFVVMYSGNLGLSQGLEHVLEAARVMKDEPVLFLFVGEGGAKPGLMARAGELGLDNVRFLPYQPKENLGQSLGAADLHLIPLRKGLAGCVVPSKLYGILAAGVPYVAAIDDDSEVAEVTRTYRCGVLIAPDCPEQLVGALRWCRENPGELREMGRRGRRVAEGVYNRQVSVARFEKVVGEAAAAGNRVLAAARSVG
jgi:glycosyltransferase involved in cell wall biosynthesis